jgi:hypothetical protein
VSDKLPSITDIEEGKNVPVPSALDITYALCGALVSRVRELNASDSVKIENILKYTLKLSTEYQFLTFRDLIQLPDVTSKIARLQTFMQWCRDNRRFV